MELVRATSFTFGELLHLHRMFRRMDILCTGAVTPVEFVRFMGPHFGIEHAHALNFFGIFDRNGEGTINFRDFVHTLEKLTRGTELNKLGFFFLIADEDESGDIKLQELKDFIFVLCRLARKDLDITQTAKDIMGEADVNRDGKINRKELIECKS